MNTTAEADSPTTPTPRSADPASAAAEHPAPEVNSLHLLGEHGLLRIEHRGALYTLRATSKGGLILTK